MGTPEVEMTSESLRYFVVGSALLVGCSGSVDLSKNDAGNGATPPGEPEFSQFTLRVTEPGLCLPQNLPTDASGLSTCRILVALPTAGNESDCLSHKGLEV